MKAILPALAFLVSGLICSYTYAQLISRPVCDPKLQICSHQQTSSNVYVIKDEEINWPEIGVGVGTLLILGLSLRLTYLSSERSLKSSYELSHKNFVSDMQSKIYVDMARSVSLAQSSLNQFFGYKDKNSEEKNKKLEEAMELFASEMNKVALIANPKTFQAISNFNRKFISELLQFHVYLRKRSDSFNKGAFDEKLFMMVLEANFRVSGSVKSAVIAVREEMKNVDPNELSEIDKILEENNKKGKEMLENFFDELRTAKPGQV